MKKNIYSCLFLLLIFLISCRQSNEGQIVSQTRRYREKNTTSGLTIQSELGDISISSHYYPWMDIEITREIETGLAADINNLEIKYNRKDNHFFIQTLNPSWINGQINLVLKIPVSIRDIRLIKKEGKVELSNYIGNFEAKMEAGSIQARFSGNRFILDSRQTDLQLTINSSQQTDVQIKNNYGQSTIQIEKIIRTSFVDVISHSGTIDLSINPQISYFFETTYTSFESSFQLNLLKEELVKSSTHIYKGKNQSQPVLKVFLLNEKGPIHLSDQTEG
ncbi:MAG: hypothetical protein MJB14_04070 [Spirochaetes bacterium]|nr:hypothetical protein [Spirochaetota bacterium]